MSLHRRLLRDRFDENARERLGQGPAFKAGNRWAELSGREGPVYQCLFERFSQTAYIGRLDDVTGSRRADEIACIAFWHCCE